MARLFIPYIVARICTVRILIASAAQYGWLLHQMDFQNAFLNAGIKSEVYIHPSKGFSIGNNVLKLNKSPYGLRESSRDWFDFFHNFTIQNKFTQSAYDCYLYCKKIYDVHIYILIHVDDMLLGISQLSLIINLKNQLCKIFKMTDLNEVEKYLGFNISHNRNQNVITIDQTDFIEAAALKFKILPTKTFNTPMENKLRGVPADDANPSIKYRNLIGTLLYKTTGTRPE